LPAAADGETAGAAVQIDTSDWDWGAAVPAEVAVPARRSVAPPEGDSAARSGEEVLPADGAPAEDTGAGEAPAHAEVATGAAQEAASSGWDWDSFAPVDESPTVRKRQVTKKETDRIDEFLQGPRVGKTAEPDFSGEIRQAYALFPEAPGFLVIPSVRDRDMHPCSNCHTWTKSDLTPRKLKKPHDNFELQHGLHGKGKFWCFTCHTLDGKGGLRTLEGQKLDFNEAYVLCSQCHAQETRDWVFGAHGKRVVNWQGERQVYNCTVCHYQHDPAIEPRAAMAGPVVRQGLARPSHWVTATSREHDVFETERVWERHAGADAGDGR
jgi:hypothetical protein